MACADEKGTKPISMTERLLDPTVEEPRRVVREETDLIDYLRVDDGQKRSPNTKKGGSSDEPSTRRDGINGSVCGIVWVRPWQYDDYSEPDGLHTIGGKVAGGAPITHREGYRRDGPSTREWWKTGRVRRFQFRKLYWQTQ